MEPLSTDEATAETLSCLKELAFDQSLMNPNQVLYLNLSTEKLSGDFRMNERTFAYEMSSLSSSKQSEMADNPLFRDGRADQDGKINKTARPSGGQDKAASSIVLKLKKEAPPLDQMAASNFYYQHVMKGMQTKERLKKAQIS